VPRTRAAVRARCGIAHPRSGAHRSATVRSPEPCKRSSPRACVGAPLGEGSADDGSAWPRSARRQTRTATATSRNPLVRCAESWPAAKTKSGGTPSAGRSSTRLFIGATAIAWGLSLGCTRRTSSAAVLLSRVKLSWASHWDPHPATIGCPAEWRQGWEEKPRSELVSASQRGQTLRSMAQIGRLSARW
jgi:hypothetical protein